MDAQTTAADTDSASGTKRAGGTEPAARADPAPDASAAPAWRTGAGALAQAVTAGLFIGADRPRPTRRQIALGALAVLLATAVSLARTRGPGSLNSIWAEDGRNFLADALNLTIVDALGTPFNGYWHIGPRVLAEVAARVPIEWAPAVLSAEAALVSSVLALIAYLACGPYVRHPALRLLVAVPAALPAAGIGWVENNVATLQFFLLYGLFWVLMWVPGTRWGRFVAVGVVLFTAFSTALALMFLPLAVARLVIRRTWLSTALLAGLCAGILLQFGGTAVGWTTRAGLGAPRYDPFWAVGDYLTKLVPTAIFGEKWTFDRMEQGVCPEFVVSHVGEHRLLVVASWAVVAMVLVVAVRRCRPAWAFAAVAVAHSVALYAATIMTLGCAANRYFVAPSLLLIAAIAALLRPRDPKADAAADATGANTPGPAGAGRLTTMAVVFLTLAAVVCVANLRSDSPRSASPRWSDVVAEGRRQCATENTGSVILTTTEPNWTMRVRCTALKR